MAKPKDITNKKFNKLTAIKRVENNKHGFSQWLFKCDCGKEKIIMTTHVTNGKTKSCGCLRSHEHRLSASGRIKDLTGQKFGKLTVMRLTDKRMNGCYVWECKCDCGDVDFYRTPTLNKRTMCRNCVEKERIQNLKNISDEIKERFGYIENTTVTQIANIGLQKNNTSGVRGVYFNGKENRFIAYITFQKKRYYLGKHKTLEKAAEARKKAEGIYFGEFLEWYEQTYGKKVKTVKKRNNRKNN